MLYTRSTPFKEFIDTIDFSDDRACQDAITWCRGIDAKIKDCTFGHGIDALDRADWAWWCLHKFYKVFDDEVRAGFVKLIKDPMISFQICLKISLSEADETELKKIYEGKLPVAEKELADGVVSKVVDNG